MKRRKAYAVDIEEYKMKKIDRHILLWYVVRDNAEVIRYRRVGDVARELTSCPPRKN
jgi:hypothetical protein